MSKPKRKKSTQPPRTGPRCPACNRATIDTGPSDLHWCDFCRAQFDNDPEDGGDYFTDPTKRMERAEERRDVMKGRRR